MALNRLTLGKVYPTWSGRLTLSLNTQNRSQRTGVSRSYVLSTIKRPIKCTSHNDFTHSQEIFAQRFSSNLNSAENENSAEKENNTVTDKPGNPLSSVGELEKKYGLKQTQKTKSTVVEMPFGHMRFDSKVSSKSKTKQNNNKHKEIEHKTSTAKNVDAPSTVTDINKANFFDEQFFAATVNKSTKNYSNHQKVKLNSDISHGKKQILKNNQVSESLQRKNVQDEADNTNNIFDKQYFNTDESIKMLTQINEGCSLALEVTDQDSENGQSSTDNAMASLNTFDYQYFNEEMLNGKHNADVKKFVKNNNLGEIENEDQCDLFGVQYMKQSINKITLGEDQNHSMESLQDNADEGIQRIEISESQNNMIVIDKETKQQKRYKTKESVNEDSAYALALSIRKEGQNQSPTDCDSGVEKVAHYNVKHQVLDLSRQPTEVVIKILHDSIIYEDDDIIAIDKPYGLASHGGIGQKVSVGQLLSPLAERLRRKHCNKLHLIHRLDKETTGVILLAKNENMANLLRLKFKQREVVKKYWVITKGVPNPSQGIIDIPMAETSVEGRYRMGLFPDYTRDSKLLMKTQEVLHKSDAITNYRVLHSQGEAALVECQPESGVKHQIRCHLALGLNTPILGDHKYSHPSRFAPQRLHSDMLLRLGIRQAQARYMPMHLHAKVLILPEFKDGKNLFISTKLPHFFVKNMKKLKLKPPQK